MIKISIISIILLLVLWILNIIVSSPIGKSLGTDDRIFQKTVSNGNNIFYCMLAIGIINISYYWFSILRWPILVFSGLFIAWELIMFIICLLTSIILLHKTRDNQINEWRCILSNLISTLSECMVLFLTVKYLFNWI
jgi:hypothetical protein